MDRNDITLPNIMSFTLFLVQHLQNFPKISITILELANCFERHFYRISTPSLVDRCDSINLRPITARAYPFSNKQIRNI